MSRNEAVTADVSYVIPTAVRHGYLRRCLASIRQWSPGSEIILVANGRRLQQDEAAWADRVVALEHNLRFAAGVNQGAREVSRPLTCVMNDDAWFIDATPQRLAVAASSGRIVGPFSNRSKAPQEVSRSEVPAANLCVEMVSGFCMMLPSTVFQTLRGFDTRLDTWEDDDLCLRAARIGVQSEVVGGTYVMHHCSTTFRAQGENIRAILSDNAERYRRLHPRFGADWILMLDADERLDDTTARHLEAVASIDDFDVYCAPLRIAAHGSSPTRTIKPFLFRGNGSGSAPVEKASDAARAAVISSAVIDRSDADPLIRPGDRPYDDRLPRRVLGPLVSIVIATSQRPTFLQRAIRSALSQDYLNLEVIVVGDRCPEVDRLGFSDPRLRSMNLASNDGAGSGVPRQYGSMLAAGEIIKYLDDDEVWSADHVSRSVYSPVGANVPSAPTRPRNYLSSRPCSSPAARHSLRMRKNSTEPPP